LLCTEFSGWLPGELTELTDWEIPEAFGEGFGEVGAVFLAEHSMKTIERIKSRPSGNRIPLIRHRIVPLVLGKNPYPIFDKDRFF